jgi:hypothetical protein
MPLPETCEGITMPTSSLIDKQKLVDAINAASVDIEPCADQRRYIYNLGRSVLAKYLLAEIALGHLDYDPDTLPSSFLED